MNIRGLEWYWHRLRAMSAIEIVLHARKRLRQTRDARTSWHGSGVPLAPAASVPRAPEAASAPADVRSALRRDAENILAGRWTAFGHLQLRVDDPPQWQKDYLVNRDLATTRSAFSLNHRSLPDGADIKLVWELSRWSQLVRLAMASHVLADTHAAAKCVAWLEDWVVQNPPYRGWNWTSALEVGLRLIQFTWIDALLAGSVVETRLAKLRLAVLPAHVRFAWRYQSSGSSANNHLIGELVGLILATTRWPGLADFGASLPTLQSRWEHEVLAQFAKDGGNREQALNYQLFSWELCWQARSALVAVQRGISPAVDKRLQAAAQFFVDVQVPADPWDYGDSDSAAVTPFCLAANTAVAEWHRWLLAPTASSGINYWIPQPSPAAARPRALQRSQGWEYFDSSGYALWSDELWRLRLDVSPLGYLRTAAHGHLDALHVSIWRNDVAMVVDPGTGAYFADTPLREWLASRGAHNAPNPHAPEDPHRLGPFLWDHQHATPSGYFSRGEGGEESFTAELALLRHCIRRTVSVEAGAVRIDDVCTEIAGGPIPQRSGFSVRWQFAPDARLDRLADRKCRVTCRSVSLDLEVSGDWAEVISVCHPNDVAVSATTALEREYAGSVSRAFRKVEWGPFIKLVARTEPGARPLFRTSFSAPTSL